ncbi:hypothetical protein, partial [Pseudomonas aeruginosa]|uniref:hypothetical protein n=2 Tax=Pseudomonas TaxID=286 RepID=UPI001C8C5991
RDIIVTRARRLFLGTEQSIDRATDQHWISITEETTTMSRHEDLLLQLIQRDPDKIRSILGLLMDSLPDDSAPESNEGANDEIKQQMLAQRHGCSSHHLERWLQAFERRIKEQTARLLEPLIDPADFWDLVSKPRCPERPPAQALEAEEPAKPGPLKHIAFSGPQRVLLDQLAQYWLRIAAVSKREAEANPNPDQKRGLEMRYMAHYNCAAELQNLLQTGELPGHLGFQVLAQKPE